MTQDEEDNCDNDLHVAVRLGDLQAAKKALKDGYHPDTIGLFEWNALHEAAHNGDVDIVKILLNYGASPNKHDILNANTALHYASSEDHYNCLEILLGKGGDPTVLNKSGKTCIDLATSESCKEALEKHGHACRKEKPFIKPILKSTKEKNKVTKVNSTSTPVISTSLIKSKQLRVAIETSPIYNEPENTSPPASIDSGTFSPTLKNLTTSREAWDEVKGGFLRIPSSPARSQGSSYGSLTSLNSSSCSAADDCAGQFVLSFQYNSKKQEFKLRLWEILLTSLLPPSKIPKDTIMHLYIKSTILLDDEFQSNPLLKRKSEIFRLQAGQTSLPTQPNQSATNLAWTDKEARVEFKNSLSLDYNGISKEMVTSSSIKVCLCIRPKRSFISNRSKSNMADPVLASTEFRMGEAVKKIMKEAYDMERHDVLGVTRQAFPLEGVIAESHSYDNHSFNSDPSVQIRMATLSSVNHAMTRSSSVGNLKEIKPRPHLRDQSNRESKVDLDSTEGAEDELDKSGTYSVTSLDSVFSHASTFNPEMKIRLPLGKLSNNLNAVVVDQAGDGSDRQKSDVQVVVPRRGSAVYDEFKRKQGSDKAKEGLAQKAKSKLKSSSRVVAVTAGAMLRPNVTAVTAFEKEERTVGSPSEEDISHGRLTFEEKLKSHSRSGSTVSLVQVDESPSPSRRHKRPGDFPRARTKPRSAARRNPTTSGHWTVNIDPEGTKIEIDNPKKKEFLEPSLKNSNRTRERYTNNIEMNMLPPVLQSNHRLHSGHLNSQHRSSKPVASRKLLYDESDFTETPSANNPCFIAD